MTAEPTHKSNQTVSDEQVLRVAALANLELTPEELPAMGRDLNAILGYIAQLNELDVANVAPMAQVSEIFRTRPNCGGARKGRGDAAARGYAGAMPGARAGDAGSAGDGWRILQGSAGDWTMSSETYGATAMTLRELGQGVISGKVKAAELVSGYLERIAERNPEINAYLSVANESAQRTAVDLDAAARRGDPLGPLAGVPVGVKDVIAIEGMTATAGSRILEGYTPPYTATAVRRLKEAGAVVLGKLNCDEFAMGSSNENSAYGVVRNPVALDRVPGGSSGGSAAAVAAEMAAASLGTDTGGSIRQPASFCGVVGVLPTYGRVSRYGLIAFASSLDRIGPFARTVEDAATILGVIAGHDPLDATSSERPVPDYVAECQKPVEGSARRCAGGVLR